MLWDWVEIVRMLHLSYFLTVDWFVIWAVVNDSTEHGTDFVMVQSINFFFFLSLSVSSTWFSWKLYQEYIKTFKTFNVIAKKKPFPWYTFYYCRPWKWHQHLIKTSQWNHSPSFEHFDIISVETSFATENYFLFFKHTIIKTKAMNKLTDSKLFQFCKCVTDVLANVSEEQNEKSTV